MFAKPKVPRRGSAPGFLLMGALVVGGCATFNPRPVEEVAFMARSQTQRKGRVEVTVAVPDAGESRELFGVPLYRKGVQPVWVEIRNEAPEAVWFLPIRVDPHYFTPLEAASLYHSAGSGSANQKLDRHFRDQRMGLHVEPGSARSGYVFTNLDEGTKGVTIDLLREDRAVETFTFFVPVPGLKVDHQNVDWENLYPEGEIVAHNEQSLREALAKMPACTKNKKGNASGDPLNLVVIGHPDDVYHAFIRAGWDETETIHYASLLKTGASFLFGARYDYSPVSALYVFGRPQDVALQKARETIHERNHLRLWMSPMRFRGKPVWIGQISRDVGVRLTPKTVVTHKIDPDVDDTRDYLIQNLWYSQGLAKFGYAKGVGEAPLPNPGRNLTGDPYVTDGFRAVLWVSGDPVPFTSVEYVEWEDPPNR